MQGRYLVKLLCFLQRVFSRISYGINVWCEALYTNKHNFSCEVLRRGLFSDKNRFRIYYEMLCRYFIEVTSFAVKLYYDSGCG